MRSFFSGSALIGATLVTSSFLFSVNSSVAETPVLPQQQKMGAPTRQEPQESPLALEEKTPATPTSAATPAEPVAPSTPTPGATAAIPAAPVTNYTATAYSLYGRTASGRRVTKGVIAADPRVLPLGSRVRLEAGSYSGEYLVADTGGSVRGKRIDIWTPSSREAMRFGRRTVKLTVLAYGPRAHTARHPRPR
jgi:3D (Asp-Asp-Asp) domain-containing protein